MTISKNMRGSQNRETLPQRPNMGNLSRMEYPLILKNIHPWYSILGCVGGVVRLDDGLGGVIDVSWVRQALCSDGTTTHNTTNEKPGYI